MGMTVKRKYAKGYTAKFKALCFFQKTALLSQKLNNRHSLGSSSLLFGKIGQPYIQLTVSQCQFQVRLIYIYPVKFARSSCMIQMSMSQDDRKGERCQFFYISFQTTKSQACINESCPLLTYSKISIYISRAADTDKPGK